MCDRRWRRRGGGSALAVDFALFGGAEEGGLVCSLGGCVWVHCWVGGGKWRRGGKDVVKWEGWGDGMKESGLDE